MDEAVTEGVLGNVAGWIVFAVNFLLPLMSREVRRDRGAALVFWLSLLPRQALALSMGFITGPISDAGWFHDWAIIRARESGLAGVQFSVGSGFYEGLLGAFYYVLGASPFLAIELSVLAFSASMIAFLSVARELGITRWRVALLALYSLPLSALFFTSNIMREAYQVLGFVLAVLFALRFRRTGSPLAIAAACASSLFMGLLHDALIMFAAVFLLVAILWPVGPAEDSGRGARHMHPHARRFVRYAVLVLLVAGGAQVVARGVGSLAVGAITSRRALEYAARFREAGATIEARTTYGLRLDTSSPGAFAGSLVPVFVYYMFSPFPWQIRTPVDLFGASEAVLRLLLIAFAVREWWRASGDQRRTRTLFLVWYFALAGIWSLGTINYGTAYRHHLTTNWILLLLGGPGLLHGAERGLRRTFGAGGAKTRLATS